MSDITLPAFRESTDLLNSPAELRLRAREEGYLFFRGLLPRETVMQVRAELLDVLDAAGLLLAHGEELSGLLDRSAVERMPAEDMRPDIGVTREIYVALQKVRAAHALPHHPALLSLFDLLLGEPVFVHPRHVIRSMTPHPEIHPTPAHQDFPHVQGTVETWTCWIPMGDCPRELGPLSVLQGSHSLGYLPIDTALGAGGIAALLCREEDDWLSVDMLAGDVLIFPSLTVHRALAPTTRDRVRLSMDARYQAASQPIEAGSLTNHADREWAVIYEEWPGDDLQYYWRADAPRLSPWDDSYLQPGVRIC